MNSKFLDSIACHALHALPRDEARLIDRAVDADPELAEELEEYRLVAEELARAFPQGDSRTQRFNV